MRYRLILFAIAAAFVACSGKTTLVMYDGERKAAANIATIEIGRHVYVMTIDSLTREYQAISDKYIEVLPGHHVIGMNYKSPKGRSHEPINLTFVAEAGHKYKVKARAGIRHWTAWIIDVGNDSIVAGSREL